MFVYQKLVHLIFKGNYSFKLNLQTGACLPWTIPACRRRLDRWWGRGEAIDQNAPWRPSLRLLSHSHYNTPLHPKISWQTDKVITSGIISCFAIRITQSTAYYYIICSVFVDQNPTDGNNYCVSSSVGIFIIRNKKNNLIWFLFTNNK